MSNNNLLFTLTNNVIFHVSTEIKQEFKISACGYVLGNSMTLADVDFLSTYSTLEACNFINLAPYKNLQLWADRMKQQIPKYAENCGKGAEDFGAWFNSNYDRKQD